jgi:uncharacterized protein YgbK (DUF1537 family)
MTAIRVLADDLTGALDTAAAFAGAAPVHIDRPPAAGEAAGFPVSVTASSTREAAIEALPGLLAPTLGWFTSGSLSFKKVDSLLRGNTFAEIAWLFRNAPFERVVFAPAFPSQGRITSGDRQWIVRPGKEREAVGGPLRASFAKLGLRAGGMLEEQPEVWIPEIATDDDLDHAVRQTTGSGVMWVGSAGLGNALARRFGLAAKAGPVLPPAAGAGPAVLVSASFQPVFRKQWAVLRASRPARAVAEAGDAGRISAAIRLARAGAREAWFDLSPRAALDPGEAARRLLDGARTLIEKLPAPGQLIVVGGDTLLSLCRASGAASLLTQPSIRPGWGCARINGGVWDGVPCHSRSGAFGAADDLAALYSVLVHAMS